MAGDGSIDGRFTVAKGSNFTKALAAEMGYKANEINNSIWSRIYDDCRNAKNLEIDKVNAGQVFELGMDTIKKYLGWITGENTTESETTPTNTSSKPVNSATKASSETIEGTNLPKFDNDKPLDDEVPPAKDENPPERHVDVDPDKANTTEYLEDGTSIEYDEFGRPLYEYNADNLRTKEFGYDGEGKLLFYNQYEYDEEGREIKDTQYDENGNPEYRYIKTEYNDDGTVKLSTWYDPEKATAEMYYRYEYDNNGNKTSVCYDHDGNAINYTKYDKDGKQIEYVYFETEDEDLSESTVDADSNKANTTEDLEDGTSIEYDENGRQKYVYDEQNRIITEMMYNENGTLRRYYEVEYSDDDSGGTVTWYNPDGSVDKTYVVSYGEYGREVVTRDSNGNLINYKLHDQDGNEVKDANPLPYLKNFNPKNLDREIVQSDGSTIVYSNKGYGNFATVYDSNNKRTAVIYYKKDNSVDFYQKFGSNNEVYEYETDGTLKKAYKIESRKNPDDKDSGILSFRTLGDEKLRLTD